MFPRLIILFAIAIAVVPLLATAPQAAAQGSAGMRVIRGGDSGDSGGRLTGGGGGGANVLLANITNFEDPITWNSSGGACQDIRNRFQQRDTVSTRLEKACAQQIGRALGFADEGARYCDVWNPYPDYDNSFPGPRVFWPSSLGGSQTPYASGKACLDNPNHTGNLNLFAGPNSNEELHFDYQYQLTKSGTPDAMRGRAVAWIVRIWRMKLVGDVNLPLRGLAALKGSDRYPIFERRQNLNPGDSRSDAGTVAGSPFNGQGVTQEQWWSGGPNGGPGGSPGNWWLNAARGGPIGWFQPSAATQACVNQFNAYKASIRARNGGQLPRALDMSLERFGGGQMNCFYDFGTGDTWFDAADGKLVREGIALAWERSERYAWTDYAIVAPAGYVYAVQVAQIDRAESIVSSSTRVVFPAPVCSGTCDDPGQGIEPAQTPPPDVRVTTQSEQTTATGSPTKSELKVLATPGFGIRESGPPEPGQQAWPLSTRALWWDAQQFSNTEWIQPNEILNVRETTDRQPDPNADTIIANPAVNPGNRLNIAVGPNVTAGVLRQVSQAVVLTPDGELAPSAGAAPIPVSRLAQPNTQIDIRRTFRVASSAPNIRTSGAISPLQMMGMADVERGGWSQAGAQGVPGPAQRQQECTDAGSPSICIERVNVRARQKANPGAPGCPPDQCYATPAIRSAGGAPIAPVQLMGAYLQHPVAGYTKVKLEAENPAGIRSLSVHDAGSENGSIRRSLYTTPGPRQVANPADPDQWSITWCRSGEHPGANLATTGGLTGTSLGPDDRGDAGCIGDYNQWSWRLQQSATCEVRGIGNPNPTYGHCISPASQNQYNLCPAGSRRGPARDYLSFPGYGNPRVGNLKFPPAGTGVNLAAVVSSDMIELRGNPGGWDPGERGTFPWYHDQAPCVVPGQWYQGRWGLRASNPVTLTYHCRDLQSWEMQRDARGVPLVFSKCDGNLYETAVAGVNVWMQFNKIASGSPCPTGSATDRATSQGCFYPGWTTDTLRGVYKNQVVAEANPASRNTTLYTYRVTNICLIWMGTGINRRCVQKKKEAVPYGYRANFPDTTATSLAEVNPGGWGIQTAGNPTPLNAIRTAGSTNYPDGGENHRRGYTDVRAAIGWQYTPRQVDCRDNMRESGTLERNVRSCPAVDAQHTGFRMPLGANGNGWYFLSGMVTPQAGRVNWSAWQAQPRGSRWDWLSAPPTTTAEPFRTRVIGLQPAR